MLWGVMVIAKSLVDLQMMRETNIVYTSGIEAGKTERRNGFLLYGTTYDKVDWTDKKY
jgi:hypothetical protein